MINKIPPHWLCYSQMMACIIPDWLTDILMSNLDDFAVMKLKTRVLQGHVLGTLQFPLCHNLHGNNSFIRRKVNTSAEICTCDPRVCNLCKLEQKWRLTTLRSCTVLIAYLSLFSNTSDNEHTQRECPGVLLSLLRNIVILVWLRLMNWSENGVFATHQLHQNEVDAVLSWVTKCGRSRWQLPTPWKPRSHFNKNIIKMYAIIQLNGAEDLSLRELPPTQVLLN